MQICCFSGNQAGIKEFQALWGKLSQYVPLRAIPLEASNLFPHTFWKRHSLKNYHLPFTGTTWQKVVGFHYYYFSSQYWHDILHSILLKTFWMDESISFGTLSEAKRWSSLLSCKPCSCSWNCSLSEQLLTHRTILWILIQKSHYVQWGWVLGKCI